MLMIDRWVTITLTQKEILVMELLYEDLKYAHTFCIAAFQCLLLYLLCDTGGT